MATAGQMIIAGDVARVLWWFEHAGRGAKGWEYAETQLRRLHPESQTNSIQAVLRIAHESIDIGTRYRRGGPNYIPPISAIPDARPLEGELPPSPGSPGGRRRSEFVHEGTVRIIDPNRDDAVVQMFNVTVRGSDVLSRSEFENILNTQATRAYDRFINYPGVDTKKYDFAVEVRIEGVYRSF